VLDEDEDEEEVDERHLQLVDGTCDVNRHSLVSMFATGYNRDIRAVPLHGNLATMQN